MSHTDIFLKCNECGNTFISPAAEQEYLRKKGYYFEPKSCPSCRQARRAQRTTPLRGKRQIYPAVCAKCGVDTELSFEPRDGIPVYCSNCYSWIAQSRY